MDWYGYDRWWWWREWRCGAESSEDLKIFEICTIFVVIVSRPLRELTYAEPEATWNWRNDAQKVVISTCGPDDLHVEASSKIWPLPPKPLPRVTLSCLSLERHVVERSNERGGCAGDHERGLVKDNGSSSSFNRGHGSHHGTRNIYFCFGSELCVS